MSLVCKSKKRVQNLLKSDGATIIECDIAKKTDRYDDRYYGNVLNDLPKDKTSNFFYNIIYLPYPKRKDIEVIDKNTPYNTIYLWDFLTFYDYITCLMQLFVRKHRSLLDYDYLGINQRPMLEYTYMNIKSSYYYIGFLYERVIYRMKLMGVNIRLYVDWWENQSIDKSLHWAMNKYYPNVSVHSYIGFMPDISENPITIATNTELDLNIAPNKLFVCNSALLEAYKKSGYKGNVELSPFYRAENIWNIQSVPIKNECSVILVPMGLNSYEVELKTKFFVNYFKNYKEKCNLKVLLKPHPVYNDESIRKQIEGIDGLKITKGIIYDILPKVDMVVAANSTTTYEALALGKPLLNIIDPLYQISLQRPTNIPDFMWYNITDVDDILAVIKNNQTISDSVYYEEGKKIRDYYFTKRTIELSYKLFMI